MRGAVNVSSPAGKRHKSTMLREEERGLVEYTIDRLWLREEQEAERDRKQMIQPLPSGSLDVLL